MTDNQEEPLTENETDFLSRISHELMAVLSEIKEEFEDILR